MTKKILSILCALAMLMTMVSIVAFSVTAADEGYADFDGLADMIVTKDTAYYGSEWYSNNATAAYDSAYYGSKVLFATQTRIVAASESNYAIDDEFSVKYYVNRAKAGDNTVGVKYGYMNEFKLGDLYILFTSPNSPVITCTISYDGQELASAEGAWSHSTDVLAGTEEHTAVRNDFIANFANCASAFGETENRIKLEVNITYADGKVTVVYGAVGDTSKQTTVEADIADADFSDAAMELSVGEKKNDGVVLYDFEGTYKTASAGGNEPGGEGEFEDLADMTVTKDNTYSSSTWWGNQGSGLYTSAKFGGAAILANQNKIVATSTATYDVENFTVEYILNRNRGGNATSGNVYGHLNTFKLGDLTVQLTSSNAPETTCTISYGGTQLATGTSLFEHHTLLEMGSTEAQAVVADMLAGFENGGFADQENRMEEIVIITYANGKVTVTYGAVDNVELRTVVEADIANADFSDATLELAVAERKNDGSVLHSFTGTYNGEVDQGGTTPPPAGDEDDDDDDQQGGTTPPPAGDEDDDDDDGEGDVVIEPSVITFDATKGTVTTATAVTNEEGKLATLPTPTYTGAGTFVFDGWYTAEAGGTKITTDTVFAEDTTVYAQWTRTLTTTAMDGFDKATCELPEDMPWNASGSGLFKTSGHGDGLVVGNQAAFGLTAELGTYNIDSYFKVDFDLWYKNKSVESGCVSGVEFQIITIGDLVITFTRSPANISDRAGRNLYLQSVTYKGQEVELVGEKNFSSDCTDQYEHNDEFVINNANVEFNQFLEDNMIRKAWMFNNNAWPNNLLAVEVTYDAGALTIKNTSGTVTNSVAADLTKVAGFDVKTAFNNSKVTARAEATDARGAFVSIISDFHGAYEKVGASAGQGSGTGTGTGTGTGNGGSNAPQTGDNRNVVLPICVALASVAVAGATLIRRKRA